MRVGVGIVDREGVERDILVLFLLEASRIPSFRKEAQNCFLVHF